MADTLLGGIVINEILVDPNSSGGANFDTDGNGTAAPTDEYVELYNASGAAIDISGLELWDQGVGQWFTFPPGTILAAGGHALVLSGVQTGGALPTGGADDLFFDAGRGSPLINNGGDNVTLYDPANDAFVQATFNGDALDDPTTYAGFSPTATQVGSGEDFGNDTDGLSVQRAGDGEDTFTTDAPTPGVANVCFADGTVLATPDGDRPIEGLHAGDIVLTADNGPQRITWVYSQTWTPDQVARQSKLAAVLIHAGALGRGVPAQDLRVSQQHRLLVRGPIAKRMFDSNEVLIPAKALLPLAGVSLETPKSDVTFYHIMLAQHEIVFSNGMAAESLFLGKQAVASIPESGLVELCELLSLTVDDLANIQAPFAPARNLVEGKFANRLVARHIKHDLPLLRSLRVA